MTRFADHSTPEFQVAQDLAALTPHLLSLELFDAVLRLGSFSAAASEFGLSQQAVSGRISQLEQQLHLMLFTRNAHGAQPTEHSLLISPWVQEIIQSTDRFRAGIQALQAQRQAEPLRICASLTIAEHLLPRWLVRFGQHVEGSTQSQGYPHLQDVRAASPRLSTGNSTRVINLVRTGAVDLGFIESDQVPGDLHSQIVGQDELVVAIPEGHRWMELVRTGQLSSDQATSKQLNSSTVEISAADFLSEPLLLREQGSGTREVFDAAVAALVRKSGLEPGRVAAVASEFPSTSALVTAAHSGRMPAVVSRLAIRDELTLGRLHLVEVTALDLHRSLHAVWKGELPSQGKALLESISPR